MQIDITNIFLNKHSRRYLNACFYFLSSRPLIFCLISGGKNWNIDFFFLLLVSTVLCAFSLVYILFKIKHSPHHLNLCFCGRLL